MSKYIYFAAGLALLVLLLAAKSIYSDNQQLKEDKANGDSDEIIKWQEKEIKRYEEKAP